MLRKLLRERGLTVTEVAKSLGIRRETLHRKINGRQPFIISEALALHEKYLSDLEFLEVFEEYKMK